MNSSKNQKISENERDRISSLPDSVLVHILSFLPTKDAVQTVLVPPFRHLWTNVHTLSFDVCSYHDCDSFESFDDDDSGPTYDKRFLGLMHNVLILHERSTIHEFHLRFHFSLYYSSGESGLEESILQNYVSKERRMASEISSWIRFAMRKKVKVLDLDLNGCCYIYETAHYTLPNIVLRSGYLTELKLAACDIKPLGQIHLNSLKTLSLQEVMLSEKTMDEILCGCPLLENLSLMDCYGFSKLNFTSPNIKKLMLILRVNEPRLKISCPNLVSLEIAGWIEKADLVNVSSLVEASLWFSYCFKFACREYRNVKMLLEKLRHSKVFKPCRWCILVLTIWELTNLPCPSFNWKCVVLEIPLTKWHLPGLSNLLRNSICLETLTIYIEPVCSFWFQPFQNEGKWIESYDLDGENYWNSQEGSFYCLTHNLRTVMLFGSITESYAIQLAEFLLKSAMVLEKMVISTNESVKPDHQNSLSSDELLEFSRKLLSIPRASTCATIHLS
ncbi:hypothetical protein F0562_010906 [Nyssa sinensis]|uniref:Uncharacterized protein n=1 Tax=Nyssa sinensis TaxID=561372 RepID=A0A5J5A0E2_9ASTE|nr:hypothetical protein F0562_010906 [Nyssa sinensis]